MSEILGALFSNHPCEASRAALLSRDNLHADTKAHLEQCESKAGLVRGSALACGLWLDGVVEGWDRSGTLECVTLSLPGLSGELGNVRFPLAVIQKDFVVKHHTLDDILAAQAQCFKAAAVNQHLRRRVGGAAWSQDDMRSGRHLRQGKALGAPAFLCQVLGDWKMRKEVFRFPQHNEVAGICINCCATPADVRNPGADAGWRRNRLTHWDFIARLVGQGHEISPIFEAPYLTTACFPEDWMHAVDQGVAADFLGQVLVYLWGRHMPGGTEAERLRVLWLRLQAGYKKYPGV